MDLVFAYGIQYGHHFCKIFCLEAVKDLSLVNSLWIIESLTKVNTLFRHSAFEELSLCRFIEAVLEDHIETINVIIMAIENFEAKVAYGIIPFEYGSNIYLSTFELVFG